MYNNNNIYNGVFSFNNGRAVLTFRPLVRSLFENTESVATNTVKHIFRVHQIFANFVSRTESRN